MLAAAGALFSVVAPARAIVRVVGVNFASQPCTWALGLGGDGRVVGAADAMIDHGTGPPVDGDGAAVQRDGRVGIEVIVFAAGRGERLLGGLGGWWTEARGAAGNYSIVGWGFMWQDLVARGFVYTDGAGFTPLGTLGGLSSRAVAMNASGQVAGYSTGLDGAVRAFRLTPGEGMVDLGPLGIAAPPWSWASGMNDHGQVVGWGYSTGGAVHAFRYTDGVGMQDLGDLGGGYSQALAINNAGAVVGWSRTEAGKFHAFLYTDDTGMIDLGTLGGGTSRATGINDAGLVVGQSMIPGGKSHAFVWTADEGMVDLDKITPRERWLTVLDATAVNNAGQIAVNARLGEPDDPNCPIIAMRIAVTAAFIRGDLNNDGAVNGADLALLLAQFGTSNPRADLTGDGVVDGDDLQELVRIWRNGG